MKFICRAVYRQRHSWQITDRSVCSIATGGTSLLLGCFGPATPKATSASYSTILFAPYFCAEVDKSNCSENPDVTISMNSGVACTVWLAVMTQSAL